MTDTHSLEAFKSHIKVYIAVFVALLVGTVITVAAWKWANFPTLTLTIVVALFIATIKAFLVAGYFMHLISERKVIYGVLTTTAVFFVAMMYLVVYSRGDMPRGTAYWGNQGHSSEVAPKGAK